MKTYILRDEENGEEFKVGVKCDKDCVFCVHCTHVFWNKEQLIYALVCDLDRKEVTDCNRRGNHTCKMFVRNKEIK